MAGLERIVAAVLLACLSLPLAPARGRWTGHNITALLNGHPEYKLFNKYLTETKVCDEINARGGVTILVLRDAAMSALVKDAGDSLGAVKNALRLHALIDYFDPKKMRKLPGGTALSDTLYQASGTAASDMGSVNITDLGDGRFAFASANPGASLDARFVKDIKSTPYDFSVMEISEAIEYDGLFDLPSISNLTGILEKAGCKRFAALVASTGVQKTYEAAMDKGLTLFAPNDAAFLVRGAPDVGKMPKADLVLLLQYHALQEYYPKVSLKKVSRPLRTLASTTSGKYNMSVVARGEDVSMDTGFDKSRVAATLLDNTPVCVYTVDSLLLPLELFAGAPALAPVASAADASSPPAPPSEDAPSEDAPPADAPSKAADHKKMKASSAAASRSIGALAAAACSVALSSLL